LKTISFSFQLQILGGILLAANDSIFQLHHLHSTANTISASVLDVRRNLTWHITGVYGPQGELEKRMFLREIKGVRDMVSPLWLLLGDFNLIY
jgi:hypothetical protein